MRMRAIGAILLSALAFGPAAAEPLDAAAGPAAPAAAVTVPLVKPPIPPAGAYLGASASVLPGESRTGAIVRTESLIGRPLDIDHQFYKWDQPLVNQTQRDDAAAGRYPFVSWKPQRSNGARVTWGSVARGEVDGDIRAQARAARDFGFPMFATFHHEPYDESLNGWGSPAEYRAAFAHVVELFRAEGATNVAWVLVLTSWDYTQGRGDAFYPGPGVVDWIAADPYNFFQRDGHWQTLASVTADFYEWGSRTGKPLMLAEWGSTEDPHQPGRKAAWFDDAAATLAGWPNIRAAVYFNNLHDYDWRIDTSPSALDAFRRLANSGHFTGAAAPPAPDPLDCDGGADRFVDVGPADVLRDAIACAAAYGIVNGTSETTFAPSVPVTRGQAATFFANVLRAAGVQLPPPSAAGFSDVEGDVHADDIRQLAAYGVITGFGDGTFRPTAPVNRGQVATFAVRAHDAVADPLARPATRQFVDITGNAHADSIDRAGAARIVAGTTRTTYEPDRSTSRAQLAAVLTRLLRHLASNGTAIRVV